MIEYGPLGWYWEKQSVNNTNTRVKICSMQPSLVVFSENETILIRSKNYNKIITINIETLGERFKLDIIPEIEIDLVNEILEKIKRLSGHFDWNYIISKWGLKKSEYLNFGKYSSKISSVLLATVSFDDMNYQFIPNNNPKPSKKKLQIRCDCSFNFRESTFSEPGRILRMPLTFGKFRIRNNRGVTKKWFSDKGFGFIEQEEGKDLFCHISDIKSEFPLGLEVENLYEFEENKNEKGWFAESVEAIYLDREDDVYNSLRSKNKEWMQIVGNNSKNLTIQLNALGNMTEYSYEKNPIIHYKSGEEIVTETKNASLMQIMKGELTFNSAIIPSEDEEFWIWKVDPFRWTGRRLVNPIIWDVSDPLNTKFIAKSWSGIEVGQIDNSIYNTSDYIDLIKRNQHPFEYSKFPIVLEYSEFKKSDIIEFPNNLNNQNPYHYIDDDGRLITTTEEIIIDKLEIISITEEACKILFNRVNYRNKIVAEEKKEFQIKGIAENKKEQILYELNNISSQNIDLINGLLEEYFEVELITPIQSWLESVGCHEELILSPIIPEQIHNHSKMKSYTLFYTLTQDDDNRVTSIGGNRNISWVIDRIEYRKIDSDDDEFDGDSDVLDLFEEQGKKISIKLYDIRQKRRELGDWVPLDYDYVGVEFISKEIEYYHFDENWTVHIGTGSNFESSPNTKNRLGVTTIY